MQRKVWNSSPGPDKSHSFKSLQGANSFLNITAGLTLLKLKSLSNLFKLKLYTTATNWLFAQNSNTRLIFAQNLRTN